VRTVGCRRRIGEHAHRAAGAGGDLLGTGQDIRVGVVAVGRSDPYVLAGRCAREEK
jgi:hypothetical protein